jgi:hypothetical protein
MTEKISIDLAQSVEKSELGVISKGRKETEENDED